MPRRKCRHESTRNLKLEYLTILDWVFVIVCHDCVAGCGHVIVWWTPRSKNALERSKEWMPWNVEKPFDSKASAVDTRQEFTALVRLRYIHMICIYIYYIHLWCCFKRDMFGKNWYPVRACTSLAMAVAKECKRSLDFCCLAIVHGLLLLTAQRQVNKSLESWICKSQWRRSEASQNSNWSTEMLVLLFLKSYRQDCKWSTS